MVNVYEFQSSDGTVFGVGTELELTYWKSEGVFEADAKLGKVVCQEPVSEDERRKAAWGLN